MTIEKAFILVQAGKVKEIPKRYLTQRFLLKCNPKETEGYYIDVPNTPLITEIIKRDQATLLPKKTFTPGFLRKECGYKNKTIMIELAEHGYLYLAPKSTLTRKDITREDAEGKSALYHSCKTGEISLIPKKAYNLGSIIKRNKQGRSCLHEAAKHGNIPYLPKRFITEATMTGKDPLKIDPIDEMFSALAREGKPNLYQLEQMLNLYSEPRLIYLEKKELPIRLIATKIRKLRKAKKFSEQLSLRSKELEIE